MAKLTEAELAKLSKADLIKLAAAGQNRSTAGTISFKVSEKGGVSVYGLGRFPVTLYGGQWNRLLGEADRLKGFMESNRAKLAVKE